MEFTVKVRNFEGPYAKLLDLIEERKLSITEVSLSLLAEEYINYTKNLPEENYGDRSSFMLVASTLMLLKVRSLLPGTTYTKNEARDIETLTQKLEILAHVQSVTKNLSERLKYSPWFWFSKMRLRKKVIKSPTNLTVQNLENQAALLLESAKKQSLFRSIAVPRKENLERVLEKMLEESETEYYLHDFAKKIEGSNSLLLSFLSTLELIKQEKIDATQIDASIKITRLMSHDTL